MKTLKSQEFVQIRRTAEVVAKSLKEKEKALRKLEKAQAELDAVMGDIEYQDNFVFNKYGVHIEDVVKRVVVKSTDKDGKELLKGVFKPVDNCVWNDEKRVYVLTEVSDAVAPVTTVADEWEITEEVAQAPVFGENGEVVAE